jgi:uncharacterized protein (TIGR03790 family)
MQQPYIVKIALTILILCLITTPGHSLEPDEILVIANTRMPGSVDLAKYYMRARHIPDNQLLLLRLPQKETCSRVDYEKKVVVPTKEFLKNLKPERRIRCLVLMYGVPLRVAPTAPSKKTKVRIKILRAERRQIKEKLELKKNEDETALNKLKADLQQINKRIAKLRNSDQESSLDSEIALLYQADYPLSAWLPNPYYIGNKDKATLVDKSKVLMVSRLDGPSEKIVMRIMADSLYAEAKGLQGIAYFDARWPKPEKKKLSGYAFYDNSIHRAAILTEKSRRMPVVVEETQKLFQPGESPNAALYCGWYSLARYVDAFTWQRGAIGYHIASSECKTLKKKDSRVWCKRMLEEGAAAVIGPVGEPYVQGFPVPEVFFGALVDGYLSLAECYIFSLPFLSWKMVLIGDPLYRPFRPD